MVVQRYILRIDAYSCHLRGLLYTMVLRSSIVFDTSLPNLATSRFRVRMSKNEVYVAF